jgi:GNAT superfamily N-acetyltransferase
MGDTRGMDRVELLSAPAIPALVAHLVRNALESGRDGEPHSRARSADDPPDPDATARRLASAWSIPRTRPGWELCFGLYVDGDIRGHLDLRGGSIETEMHRAMLGMGIERPYRRRGWGRKMIEAAIAWSRGHGLAWLDLGVFTENAPAHALYVSVGFVEIGVTPDRFRIDGQAIGDRAMVLAL